ncbi:MAG TPA: D-2-hydroxyacid dehydrogenase [Chloroflexota bacterium]|nr:D-2-hydroxyacid dehydrogenase [Chloroflexota bacterium]
MIERPTILVTPHFVVRPDQLERLGSVHQRVVVRFAQTPEEFGEVLPDADAVVTGFKMTEELLAAAPRLRWLQVQSAGVERVLTPALAASPVTITATKGPMDVPMAEHVVTLMLALARDLPGFFRDQTNQQWRRYPAQRGPLLEVRGRTILVAGVGGVGGAVARMCKAGFQMRVLGLARTRREHPYVDAFVDRERLAEALGEADFISLTLPATPETRHFVDERFLALMKPTSYLINIARGNLVDEAALVKALESGGIAGAGLDAFAAEPLDPRSPLWRMPNVIITPHTSAITDRLGDHFVDFWAENIRRFAEGEPLLGLVDKAAGY